MTNFKPSVCITGATTTMKDRHDQSKVGNFAKCKVQGHVHEGLQFVCLLATSNGMNAADKVPERTLNTRRTCRRGCRGPECSECVFVLRQ